MEKIEELSQVDSWLLFSKPIDQAAANWFARQLKKYKVRAEPTTNNVRVHLFDLANAINAKDKILKKHNILVHAEQKLRKIIRQEVILELSALSRAEDLALDVHSGQVRKSSGLPYYVHPYRVYQKAKSLGLSKEHQLLAILHDTFEDAKNPSEILDKIRAQFGSQIAARIELLSHDKSVDYTEYLLDLWKKDKIAFDVKLLDILDNIKDNPVPSQKRKYEIAIQYLVSRNVVINYKIKNELYKYLDM